MTVSAIALAAALVALVVVRLRAGLRQWWRALAWAGAAMLLAWIVGYAALVRAFDPGLVSGTPSARPFALGGWAGAAVAALGALRTRGPAH